MQMTAIMTDRQAEITKRWSNGDGYDAYIQDELASFRKSAWKKQILSHFPAGQTLNILDVGTGPGLFPCILSEEGHRVTGIDCSEGMLQHARENARRLGVSPQFLIMDTHKLDFPVESFDLVVSRNVSWTLHTPELAYAEWRRVLRPGGRVLIYDANWHLQFYNEEIDRQVKRNEQAYYDKFGKRFYVCSYDADYKQYYDSLPLSNVCRPEWDVHTLERLGFETVQTRLDIGQDVYENWEKELYSASPLFEIEAVKA